ncbi:type IV-A pilus assembly ATPase PilB [Pseudobacteriovorax antillogorgiicola]|uniref:Type IV pilus assembly protein PilB n=1 Tax=Pseudobacteriovorax antillogorgiicola TaxID=1513793 RepID=A0A1Y6B825_9BACT|nr:type IV-A pilus assembly ATPase PilB [Pseudobacteriovorax antillogorgiicola]TCS59341.1 type IV pilus assembly protein PilB [Pseudobacteriovorax antillogorgiicola]SME89150.1 type IV pilus assembly protein PilB [Pseudobacteriovorax antillogorgiicola]
MSNSFKDIITHKLKVPSDVYAKAEALAKEKGILLVHALIRLKSADPKVLLAAYSHCYKIKVADLDAMDIPNNIISLVPPEIARKSRIIPLDRVGNNIIVALENPQNLKQIDLLRFKTGFSAKTVLAGEEQISRAIERYYPVKSMDIDQLSKQKAGTLKHTNAGRAEKRATINEGVSEESGPVIQIVDQILLQCVSRGASDIHIEPYENFLRVRLRIDGALHEIARPPAQFKPPITSRFKIMAGLNIAEKRLPQDGNISVTILNRPIDFRVNTLPTVFGEKIVLRILDKSALNVDLTKLGFEPDDFERFKKSIHQPFGMVLVTGPTGSGKTTTLYSALADLNKVTENIMTAEDPVEFTIDGINQVHINAQIGMTFASALRAFLRQDPDIIMLGEIRDLETGEIAIKAALTGHLVLSTLHTNSAADTIVRLQNMGIESFNLISALNAIVAQRLARKICDGCRIHDQSVKPEYLIELGIPHQEVHKVKAYKGAGCDKCSGAGTRGRVAIHEVMTVSDELRSSIMKGDPAMILKDIAMEDGMRTLRQNALRKMARGEIDVVEVVKSTASDSATEEEGAA